MAGKPSAFQGVVDKLWASLKANGDEGKEISIKIAIILVIYSPLCPRSED